jgi:hypothetical protein
MLFKFKLHSALAAVIAGPAALCSILIAFGVSFRTERKSQAPHNLERKWAAAECCPLRTLGRGQFWMPDSCWVSFCILIGAFCEQ